MDYFRGFVCPLASGNGDILYIRGIYPRPPHRGFGLIHIQHDSGPKAHRLVAKTKNMKPIIWVGILLIVLGGLALAYHGFNYTHREHVMDVGPMHVTTETQDRLPIPPILGGIALVGGIALLVVGGKKNS